MPQALEKKPKMQLHLFLGVILLATLVLSDKCSVKPPPATGKIRSGSGPWVYDLKADNGPENWFRIDCPKYNQCSARNKKQSPINIDEDEVKLERNEDSPFIQLRRTSMKYQPSVNDFAFSCTRDKRCGQMLYFDDTYYLRQVHFHSPSENALSGQRFAMEAHFVHTKGKDITVLAVFIAKGCYNPHFQRFMDAARCRGTAHVDLTELLRTVKQFPKFYKFEGSLTTPPCTGGVNWVLSRVPIYVSSHQVAQFRKFLGGKSNSRPLQPTNNRKIKAVGSY